ncbi:MAG: prepilin-type N-terminal cleavage/methylation domain-containing protein [Phycisphaerae bacterium]|nr:prepilin-type N-terminal cleavage/methylation domain-containing protein [Phycisphaerae bacterium]
MTCADEVTLRGQASFSDRDSLRKSQRGPRSATGKAPILPGSGLTSDQTAIPKTSAPRLPVRRAPTTGFTLVELLVVVGVILILIAVLLPSLGRVRQSATFASCLSNLHQIGLAIQMYAGEQGGSIPYGPKARRVMTATEFYPSTGAPTSLISLSNGKPVGIGLLLRQHLASQPRVLFCPGADQAVEATDELAKVGFGQAQGCYFYRHDSVTRLFDPVGTLDPPEHVRLANLGLNRNGSRIRALVMDTQLLASSGFATFGIRPRTHHSQQSCGVLAADGHARRVVNKDGALVLNLDDPKVLGDAFGRILSIFEAVDNER